VKDNVIELDFVENWKLFHGDACEVLKKLPDESVDCCVTSPPYYNLRDYGTGRWEGGDPNCDHVANPNATKKQGNSEFNENRASRESTHMKGFYKDVCPKCGARRVDEQIGLEDTPEEFIKRLVCVFREVKRVLKTDGTLWINIGDSYNSTSTGNVTSKKQKTNVGSLDNMTTKKLVQSCKPKDLIGIPWMLAFALRADGWYLRQDIIWHKPNPMPESITDRCTKAHEYIFLLSKSKNYYFDYKSIQEEQSTYNPNRTDGHRIGGNKYHQGLYKLETYKDDQEPEQNPFRNKRDVWTVNVGGGYSDENDAHYATYPRKLIEPCILAGCPKNGVVLDPFNGTGTTGSVALEYQRKYIGIDLSDKYIEMAAKRLERESAQCCLFDDEYGVA